MLRTELAEISHARYDLLNIDRWVAKLLPILDDRVDALDLKAASQGLGRQSKGRSTSCWIR